MKSRRFGSSRSLWAAALFALLPVIAASPAAASFSSCVAGLQEAAIRAGVSRSVWDYLGFLVDEQRIADGRAMMRQYEQILRAAERRFGVDRHVIAAVWATRSIPTIRPNPTRSPSPTSPTASPATRRFAPPGRPTIPA